MGNGKFMPKFNATQPMAIPRNQAQPSLQRLILPCLSLSFFALLRRFAITSRGPLGDANRTPLENNASATASDALLDSGLQRISYASPK